MQHKMISTIRLSATFAISALTMSVALGQTLPPPAYAGQSYWFGPGPASYSVTNTVQQSGGYAEFVANTSGTIWTPTQMGGPALVGAFGGPQAEADFNAETTLHIQPYIYVDGYFGLDTRLAGAIGGSSVNVGTSRFYIVHNCPIQLVQQGFTNLTGSGPSPAVYAQDVLFTMTDYANPSNYSTTLTVHPATLYTTSISPTDDEGILQVDATRLATLPNLAIAGDYTSVGIITVQSA